LAPAVQRRALQELLRPLIGINIGQGWSRGIVRVDSIDDE
jgi:hypothetical protein